MNKYIIKWGYNTKLGECRQFWYSGCGGNDNRFSSKKDCDKVCISPSNSGKL